jgi:outer membrane protein insertion porin family
MCRVAILTMLALATSFGRGEAAPPTLPTIEIAGNHAVATDVLRDVSLAQLRTEARPRDDDAIGRSALAVTTYYWDHGYAQGSVQSVEYSPATDTVRITVAREGPVYTIGSVALTGNDSGDAAMVKLRTGTTFSRAAIVRDRETLAELYQQRGYAYASVVPFTKLDLTAHAISITFEVTRGKLIRYGAISIAGKHADDDAMLRDKLAVATGEQYTLSALDASRRRLEALGLVVAVSTKPGPTDDVIDVAFDVVEK